MKLVFPGIMLFTALILIIPGILVKYFKAYWLISGYNTMSQEKKKNVDIAGLSGFIGNFCFVMAGIILLAGAFMAAGKGAVAGIVAALIFPASIYMLIRAQRYDGNTRNPDGTMKTGTKILIGAVSALLVLVFFGVGVLLYQSSKPTEFLITDGYLEIRSLYGERIKKNDMKAITLKDSLPEILSKTNGSSLGSMKKGNFKLQDIGDARLFLDASMPPFIYIERDDKPVILNTGTPEATRELYDVLTAE